MSSTGVVGNIPFPDRHIAKKKIFLYKYVRYKKHTSTHAVRIKPGGEK
jgi:hypothetical protein